MRPRRFRVHPATTRMRPRRFRVHPATTRMRPRRFRADPATTRMRPRRFRVHPAIMRIRPRRFRVHSAAAGSISVGDGVGYGGIMPLVPRTAPLLVILSCAFGCNPNGNSVAAHKDVLPPALDGAPAAPAEDSPLIVASSAGIMLGAAKLGALADVPERGDFAPLAGALAPLVAPGKGGESGARILAHQSVSFAALLTLATTAQHAGARRVVLLGNDSHGKASGVALEASPSIAGENHVIELPDGFLVWTKGGHLGPGCKSFGAGTTVPRHTTPEGNRVPDHDALRSCLFGLRAAAAEPKLSSDVFVVTERDGSITQVASLYATIGVILSVNASFQIALGNP